MRFNIFKPIFLAGAVLAVIGVLFAYSLTSAPRAEAQSNNYVQNLTASQTGLGEITATWDAPSSGHTPSGFYSMRVRAEPNGPWVTLRTTDRQVQLNGYAPGAYTVEVAKEKGANTPADSDYASVTVVLMGSVAELTATPISHDTIRVSWSHLSFIRGEFTNYSVLVGAPPPKGQPAVRPTIVHVSASQTSVDVTGLDPDTNYFVDVRARTNGAESDIVEGIVTLPAPRPVSGVNASGVENGLRVSWTALPERNRAITFYEVRHTRDGGDYATGLTQGPFEIEETSHTVLQLSPGQKQKAGVRSCDLVVGVMPPHVYCSAWTETSGTPTAPPADLLAAPGAPRNLRLTVVDGSRLNVQWDAPATGWEPETYMPRGDYAFKYVVKLTNVETGKTVVRQPGYKKQRVNFQGLKPETTYRVGVRGKIRDPNRGDAITNANWVKSAWTSATITVAEAGEGAGTGIGTQPVELIWIYLDAGEPTPPYAVGEPTKYVRLDPTNGSRYVKFDLVAECKAAIDKQNAVKAQVEAVEEAQARVDEYREILKGEAPGSPAAELASQWVKEKEGYLAAAQRKLVDVKAKLASECEAKYPPENLTEADGRWVQVPKDVEELKGE